MKLTVIGFRGGYPGSNEATSTYLLEKDGCKVVLDLGSGGLLKLQNYLNVTEIDAVVLSHYHADHIADIGVLQHALLTEAQLGRVTKQTPIYGHNENELEFNQLTDDYTLGIAYDPTNKINIGPFEISFLKTVHSVPCYGMRITDGKKTIVYTADTGYQKEWIDFAENADLLITDTNLYDYQKDLNIGHMTSTQAAQIARKGKVKTLILSHLPQYGNNQDLIDEAKCIFKGNVFLAEEGLIWEEK